MADINIIKANTEYNGVDTTAAPDSITLGATTGKQYHIANIGTGGNTLTVNYGASTTLLADGKATLIFYDGANWIEQGEASSIVWNSSVLYAVGEVVWYVDAFYKALLQNINSQPDTNPSDWEIISSGGVTWDGANIYNTNDIVWYTDNVFYKSLVDDNVNNTPSSSPTDWEAILDVDYTNLQVVRNTSNIQQGVNYDNRGMENSDGILGYSLYNDGAVSDPVDGTGGTPSGNLAISAETTTPIIGARSLKISKGAFNCQGEGVSYSDFTLDLGQRGQELQISFKYKTGGSYANNDVGAYLYDIDNAGFIPLSVSDMPETYGQIGDFFCTFYSSDSENYRLIWHVKTTNALAWDLWLDNIQPAAKTSIVGAAVSGPFPYTPTVVGLGVPTNVDFNWWQVGDRMIIDGDLTVGSTSASLVYCTIPSGYTIKENSFPDSIQLVGRLERSVSDANAWHGLTVDGTLGYDRLYVTYNSGVLTPYAKVGGTTLAAPGNRLHFHAEIEISTWTSNITMIESKSKWAYNTQGTPNTPDTTSFGYGIDGALILAHTATTSLDVEFSENIQITDMPCLELRHIASGRWIPYDQAIYISGTNILGLKTPPVATTSGTAYGLGISPKAGNKFSVVFGTYAASVTGVGDISWATLIGDSTNGYDRWRVRNSANSNPGEVPPLVVARYSGNAVTTSGNILKYTTLDDRDTHSTYNTTSGQGTIKVSGLCTVTGDIDPSSDGEFAIRKNGSYIRKVGFKSGDITQIVDESYYNVSDVVDIYIISGAAAVSTDTVFSIVRKGN